MPDKSVLFVYNAHPLRFCLSDPAGAGHVCTIEIGVVALPSWIFRRWRQIFKTQTVA